MKKIGKKIILIIMILLMTFGMCINFEERKVYAEETNTEESNLSEEIETPENESEINGIEEAEVDIPDMEEPEASDEEDEEEELKEYLMSKDVVVSATPEYIKLEKKGSKGTITTSISPSTISQSITCKSTKPSVVSVSKSGNKCIVKAKKKKGSAVIIIRSNKYGYRLTAVQVVIGSSSPTTVDNSIMENAKSSGTDLSICYEEPANVTEETFWSCVKMQYTKNELLNEGEAVETNTSTKVTKLSCPKKVTVTKVKTKQIKCEIPSNKNVTYTVKNKKIATVDSKGKVKGIKKGSTKVTVKISNKEKKTVTIKVTDTSSKKKTSSSNKKTVTKKKTTKKVKVTKVSITNCPSKEIKINESKTLNKKIEPSNATNKKVKWTSNKQNVLSVDSKGKIKGLAKGTATVTVITQDGSKKKATCKVKVSDKVSLTSNTVKPTSMTVSENKKTIAVGNSGTIKLNFTPSNATKTVSWNSSNNNIATVDSNGKIIGKKVGTAVVTVTSSINPKLVQKIKVEVTKKVKIGSMRFEEYGMIIKPNETFQAKVIFSPEDVTDKKITWEVNKNGQKIVKIDQTGKITALKEGQAVITVRSKADSKIKASFLIVVKKDSEAFLALNERTVILGTEYNVKQKITKKELIKNATYKSSNTDVATISEKGIITTKKVGKTKISVTINEKTESFTLEVIEQKPTGIAINYKSIEIPLGTTKTLKATVIPETSANKEVIWSSNNKKVVTVDKNGKIKGIKEGTATITARTFNYKKMTVDVKVVKKENGYFMIGVEDAVTKITLNREEVLLGVGGNYKMIAKTSPSTAKKTNILWSSLRPHVATIDSNGKITAIKKGVTIIRAYSEDNHYVYGEAIVTVQDEQIKISDLKLKDVSIVQGESKVITPEFIPYNATNQKVTYSIDNPLVAKIDQNGKVTGVAVGEANISAVSEENNEIVATSKVTITKRILPESIKLNKKSATIKVGKTVTLKATVLPTNTTNKKVVWTSENKKIATVDSKGKVKGIKAGKVAITASTVEGNTIIMTACEITVKSNQTTTNNNNNNNNNTQTNTQTPSNNTNSNNNNTPSSTPSTGGSTGTGGNTGGSSKPTYVNTNSCKTPEFNANSHNKYCSIKETYLQCPDGFTEYSSYVCVKYTLHEPDLCGKGNNEHYCCNNGKGTLVKKQSPRGKMKSCQTEEKKPKISKTRIVNGSLKTCPSGYHLIQDAQGARCKLD